MTQEEKQLLLIDLCARLPYGVYVHHPEHEQVFCLEEICLGVGGYWRVSLASNRRTTLGFKFFNDGMKPYLRSMSSMTEEEEYEYHNICISPINKPWDVTDWLNKKVFDYRGLIPMGLALEATDGMYKTDLL